jgi:asparagine synthase (glutamine-hydrolysing)
MSGVAAIGLRHEAPVQQALLASMERVLTQRGPDRTGRWTGNRFALVHTLFRTVDESAREEQPLSFDGQVWITADARIDAREELIAKLHAHARPASLQEPDVHLILHAFHVWGTACLEHLLGDFAFVIVDTRMQKIFAARDHLGVKPLFWATVPDGIVVSNMLDCVRCHPQVTDTLNDSWICDFLLFGWNTDVAASAFADIHRLPPAHRLEWTPEGMKIERYWTLTVPEIVRRRRQRDYIEAFTEVFRQAIADRLRTDKVVISLSGGIDSSSIAATMMPLLARRSPPTSVQAVTAVYDRLIPDQERYYAGLVANQLGIPIEFVAGDDLECFGPDWDTSAAHFPEPAERGLPLPGVFAQRLGAHGRVVLSGEGGDETMSAPYRYFHLLLRERQYLRFVAEYWRDCLVRPRFRLLEVWQRLFSSRNGSGTGTGRPAHEMPGWIQPDLVERLDLRSRWDRFWNPQHPSNSRTPRGYIAISSWLLAHALSDYDGTATRIGVEYRFPFLDLRLINTAWSMPTIPFRYYKYLLREPLQRNLPRQVLMRPKQPLAGDPLRCDFEALAHTWDTTYRASAGLSRYCSRPPNSGIDGGKEEAYTNLRFYELACWMRPGTAQG